MTDRRRVDPDAEVLPAALAERVLKRASELDAARNAGTAVAELRAAAAEAGISTDAFDAALGELQKADAVPAPVAAVRSSRRWRGLFVGLATIGAFVLAAAMIFIPARMVAPATGMVQQTIQLNCLSPDRAAELIQPLLSNKGTVVTPPKSSSTIIVRATPEELKFLQATIDKADNAQVCARK